MYKIYLLYRERYLYIDTYGKYCPKYVSMCQILPRTHAKKICCSSEIQMDPGVLPVGAEHRHPCSGRPASGRQLGRACGGS